MGFHGRNGLFISRVESTLNPSCTSDHKHGFSNCFGDCLYVKQLAKKTNGNLTNLMARNTIVL